MKSFPHLYLHDLGYRVPHLPGCPRDLCNPQNDEAHVPDGTEILDQLLLGVCVLHLERHVADEIVSVDHTMIIGVDLIDLAIE